jgi:hypothetical protein
MYTNYNTYPRISFWECSKEINVSVTEELDILITEHGVELQADFDGHYGAYYFYQKIDACDIIGWSLLWQECYGQEV